MTYLIDLKLNGKNYKMNGTIEDIKENVEKIGGNNLSIFDSRSGHFDKIVQFDFAGHRVTGHAVEA